MKFTFGCCVTDQIFVALQATKQKGYSRQAQNYRCAPAAKAVSALAAAGKERLRRLVRCELK